MRNIWTKTKNKKINIVLVLSILFCIGSLGIGVYGIQSATKATDEQEVIELENSINRAITLCYATEGSYPTNIDYLKVNYGLEINEDKYIVHYDIFASNIPPEVQVFKIK